MHYEATYSYGPLHMDEQKRDDQLEPIYNSSVPIQDVALKTPREQWTIETGVAREAQGDPCWQRDMMMMIIKRVSVWVLFNGISTSIDHLMIERVRLVLSFVCLLGFRAWFFIRFWWKGWFLLESSRFPQVWCFWRGLLGCLSGSILGEFV